MSDTIKIDGLRELNTSLRRFDKEYPKELRAINLKVAEPVAERAKRKVRSRSGRLANSIKPQAGQRYARVAAGSRLKYAGVNHYGWPARNITGNPYLTDALREMSGRSLRTFEDETQRFIERIWVTIS